MDPDLLQTQFFSVLRRTHTDLFELAANGRWLIAIPPASGVIDEAFLKAHILRPGDTDDYYITCTGTHITVDGATLLTRENIQATVCEEQVAYNSNHEPYRVVQISRRLDSIEDIAEQADGPRVFFRLTPPSYAPDIPVVSETADMPQLQRVADRVRQLCQSAEAEEIQKPEVAQWVRSSDAARVQLRSMLNTWAVAVVMPGVVGAVRRLNAVRDEQLNGILIWLNSWPISTTLELLEVPSEPAVDLSAAVIALKQFGEMSLRPPHEQFVGLQAVTTCIVEAVREAYDSQPRDSLLCDAGDVAGADLLVPLLIGCIILARPPMLVSSLAVLDLLQPEGTEVTEAGFHLCNLQVAVLCLLQHNLGPDTPKVSNGSSHAVLRLGELGATVRELTEALDCKAREAFHLKKQAQEALHSAVDALPVSPPRHVEVVSDAMFEELQTMTMRHTADSKYGQRLAAAIEELSTAEEDRSATTQQLEMLDRLVGTREALKAARCERDLLHAEHAQAVEDRENLMLMFRRVCSRVELSRRSSMKSHGSFSHAHEVNLLI